MIFKRKKETTKEQEIAGESSEALKILKNNIPGYVGYKDQEFRRQSDISFRKKLLKLLRESDDTMSKAHELLIQSQQLTSWGVAQMIKKTLKELRANVSKPDYKYSTFFEIDDVEGENGIDLSIMYLLEIEILDNAEELKERIDKIRLSLDEMMLETLDDQLATILSLGKNLKTRYNERIELIRAFEKMKL